MLFQNKQNFASFIVSFDEILSEFREYLMENSWRFTGNVCQHLHVVHVN